MKKQNNMKKKLDLGKITIKNFENDLDRNDQRQVKGGDGRENPLNTLTPVFCKP